MASPYVALYPSDFLADIGHLGNTELGIYWRLLLVYYRDGRPLPFDTDRLRRLAMTFSPEECRALEQVVAEFFVLSTEPDGSRVWRHKRADTEIERATKYTDAKRSGAEKARAKLAEKRINSLISEQTSALGSDLIPRGEPEPEPEPEVIVGAHTKEAPRKRSADRGSRLASEWVLPKSWGEWAVSELGMSVEAVRLEAAKFKDYWTAKTGRDATKADWQATWRNWCRNSKPVQTVLTSADKFSGCI